MCDIYDLQDKLEELALPEFANELAKNGQGKRLLQLEGVKDELRCVHVLNPLACVIQLIRCTHLGLQLLLSTHPITCTSL